LWDPQIKNSTGEPVVLSMPSGLIVGIDERVLQTERTTEVSNSCSARRQWLGDVHLVGLKAFLTGRVRKDGGVTEKPPTSLPRSSVMLAILWDLVCPPRVHSDGRSISIFSSFAGNHPRSSEARMDLRATLKLAASIAGMSRKIKNLYQPYQGSNR
jgi:hypothetical protein